jgi:RimJ/RimL family protein N-acetyltransferase
VNRETLAKWISQGQAKAKGFEFGFWDGPYPEEYVESFLNLVNIIANSEPHDDLDKPETIFTVENIRQREAMEKARGIVVWTAFIRDLSSGTFVGFSEINEREGNEAILYQYGTGVRKEYRNRGFGKWLKAAMLDRILHEKRAARFVRSENANSNAPMRKINQKLGYQPLYAETHWQVALDQIREITG